MPRHVNRVIGQDLLGVQLLQSVYDTAEGKTLKGSAFPFFIIYQR